MTFWISVISSIGISATTGVLTGGAILPIIIPILTVFLAWVISVGTISISYNERILGGMESVVELFENSPFVNVEFDEKKGLTKTQYYQMKKNLECMAKQIDSADTKLDAIYEKLWGVAALSAEKNDKNSPTQYRSKFSLWKTSSYTFAENEPLEKVATKKLKQ